jgi:hypothetical protein
MHRETVTFEPRRREAYSKLVDLGSILNSLNGLALIAADQLAVSIYHHLWRVGFTEPKTTRVVRLAQAELVG